MLGKEVALTESLDERGLLDAARGPGVYAVAVAVPDALEAVRDAWDAHHDARPDGLDRLAAADRVAYVGASTQVYARLAEHVTGARRGTAFLAAYPPERVVDVWPDDEPFDAEFNRAAALSREGWLCWRDGELM